MGKYPLGAIGAGSSSSPHSPVGCMPSLGSARGTSSRGDENSRVGISSPMSPAYQVDEDLAANNQDDNDSSPDEIQEKGKGKNWSKREDELLIAAWVHNSYDPIDGNSKRTETYWKEVATEYNQYATKEQKKTVVQCKMRGTPTSAMPNISCCRIVQW
ncbi:hypothetical protein D1007_00742 [Hordeum vulgare]|nr:hypothetical protein D1007_00742 [Hordeum vulgare]